MNKVALLLAASSLLAGCGKTPEEKVMEAVRAGTTVVDVESVQLRKVAERERGLCGWISYKTPEGVTTSFQPFVAFNDKVGHDLMVLTPEEYGPDQGGALSIYQQVCATSPSAQ